MEGEHFTVYILTIYKYILFITCLLYAGFLNFDGFNVINMIWKYIQCKTLQLQNIIIFPCMILFWVYICILNLYTYAHQLKLFSFFREDDFSSPSRNKYECSLTQIPVPEYQVSEELKKANFVFVYGCGILKQAHSTWKLEPSYWFKSVENEMATSYWSIHLI